MRLLFRSFVFVALLGLMIAGPHARAQEATPATPVSSAACTEDAALDLPAVTLTHADLTEAGFEGFGNSMAGAYSLEDDVPYLAESLGRDESEVAAILNEAGYLGSYLVTQGLPSDPADRSSVPTRDIEIIVFPFTAHEGAAQGYELLTDESGAAATKDIEGPTTFGEAAEWSLSSGESDAAWGLPYKQLELEFLRGCFVVALSLWHYGPDAIEPEVAELEPLAERLVERVDTVVGGRSPGLNAQLLNLQGETVSSSFVVYLVLEGEIVREGTLTDEEFAERENTWAEYGFENAIRGETPIPSGQDGSASNLTLYNTLIQFRDEAAASAYMQGLVDRFSENSDFVEVENLAGVPTLGDESAAIALTRETDGQRWTLNEMFARVGDIVTVTWIEEPFAGAQGPEVGVKPLAELTAAQVACLEAGGDCPPAPVPGGFPTADTAPAATPAA